MPTRFTPLATGEIYHIVNRGVNYQPIFTDKRDYQRALKILSYYRFRKPTVRFSYFNRLPLVEQQNLLKELSNRNKKIITLLAFSFMPNHFHLLLRQESDNGISKFLANFQNSFTKFFNARYKRTGHLLQGQFKAVRIETESQLLHTSRYIHLNPYTSYIVKTVNDLKKYSWSSLKQYLGNSDEEICDIKVILSYFQSTEKYLQFVLDQKDYQRKLDQIKHLLLE